LSFVIGGVYGMGKAKVTLVTDGVYGLGKAYISIGYAH
jgi:alanine dehydrogenase